jgi:hypothetical protein
VTGMVNCWGLGFKEWVLLRGGPRQAATSESHSILMDSASSLWEFPANYAFI